jgi:O-antigen ligase
MLLLMAFPFAGLIEMFYDGYLFWVGGIRIQPLDFIYFCMLVSIGNYALRHPRSMRKLLRQNLFLTAFLTMVAVYVIVCTPIYGQSAVGEARKYYFIFLIPVQALISVKTTEDLRRVFLAVVFAAGVVSLIALVGLLLNGSIVRVLGGEATFTIALVAIAIMIHRIYGIVIINPVMDKALLWLFFIIVLASGQRTASLGFGFGLVLAFCLYIRRLILVSKMFMLAMVIVMGFATTIIIFPETGSRLLEKLGGIMDPSSDATASWRIQNWEANWNTIKENLFFGDGLGSYYSWKIGGKWEVKAFPHNGYVQMMLKFGLFGSIIYVLLAVQFFRRTLRIRRQLQPGPIKAYVEMGILTFGATQAYILGYGIETISLIFFAITVAAAKLGQSSLQAYRTRTQAVWNGPRIVSEPFRPHRRSEDRPLYS